MIRYILGRFEKVTNILSEELLNSLSADRLGPYLEASGHDLERALDLYLWNLSLSASFYPLLATIEVCLRNKVEARLRSVFSQSWWADPRLHEAIGRRGKGTLLRAVRDIRNRGADVTEGRIVAELSFGFWANMLLPKHKHTLWSDLHSEFEYLPAKIGQDALRERCQAVRRLRNRISHHETLLGRNITQDYGQTLELLGWLSPAKAAWIKPHLETMKILRQRP